MPCSYHLQLPDCAILTVFMLSASSPFSLILFGASGHLAKLKLYPALYILALKKRLPKKYAVVGFSRTEMDEEAFRKLVSDAIHENVPAVNEDVLTQFLTHVHYHQGQYDDPKDFLSLSKRLHELEKGWAEVARLAYLSVPPAAFTQVTHNLCEGTVQTQDTPVRCIVEKPVGGDLKTFEKIKKQLASCFPQGNIYLLDHYMGKEAVRNVYYLRLANPVVETLLQNSLIHHVEITAAEDAGLEGRAGYFEQTGTLRDMFQSHLLMMAALVTMPLSEKEDAFIYNRSNALKQFYLPPAGDLEEVILQGQYARGTVLGEDVPAYVEEEGVSADSRTNTYVALKLLSRAARWQGVPFYLRSGKRLQKKETRISLHFQEQYKSAEGTSSNCLEFILQGEAGMRISLQTKVGGTEPAFRPLILTDPLVCIGDCLPEHSLLILEAIHGKQQWYSSFEEAQIAWRLIDPLQAYLDSDSIPLHLYPAGSMGPKEADEWIAKDGVKWL